MPRSGMDVNMSVGDIMSHPVIHLLENQTLLSAAQTFSQLGISAVPVIDANNQYVGILSQSDFFTDKTLERIHFNWKYMQETPIQQIMNQRTLITVPVDATVEEATRVMLREKIHRVFVTNHDEEIIGVVSSFDVLCIPAQQEKRRPRKTKPRSAA